ncbi:MAG: DUF1178 family protein [Pseudomonadota bacterium]
MIVYDLQCDNAHRFEGWFGSSEDFDSQVERGLLECPECGSRVIVKAPMAPAVPAKGNTKAAETAQVPAVSKPTQAVANQPMPAEMKQAMQALAKAQQKALANSTWVGSDFAETSRAMHYGERDEAAIHGRASLAEAKSLVEEGVPIAPLPFPVAPPDEVN